MTFKETPYKKYRDESLDKGIFNTRFYDADELGTTMRPEISMEAYGDKLRIVIRLCDEECSYTINADVVKDMMKVLRKVKG